MKATDLKAPYGVWAMYHKCWIGKEDGPLRYETWQDARVAATILTEMLGQWCRPTVLPRDVHQTGELKAMMTGAEAIARIEGREKKEE